MQKYSRSPLKAVLAAVIAVLGVACGPDLDATETQQTDADLGTSADSLYVGDSADSTIKRFDARTGVYLGVWGYDAIGPRGLVFGRNGSLAVTTRDATHSAGAVLSYDKSGYPSYATVAEDSPDAPFAPRGMIRLGGNFLVADMGDGEWVLSGNTEPNPHPARVAMYDEVTGALKGTLKYSGFSVTCDGGVCTQYSPRGIVVGPDLAIYVTAIKYSSNGNQFLEDGRIIRFATVQDEGTVFVDGATCGCMMIRPEGLTFSDSKKLYVAVSRKELTTTNKILIFNGTSGAYEDKIDLDVPGLPRATAQALVFGPNGRLYVPINGSGAEAGAIRAYDVKTKAYFFLVRPSGSLISPWYLTFGRTNPTTLAY